MRGIVCDKCGKVVLLEAFEYPTGIYHLSGNKTELELDFCEDCVQEILERVRNRE